ncbi:MAG: SulP family inorganic anion transporter [Candidatus Woesebacteria bacterium]|jgi:SulP family sulfate permease
MPSFSTRLKHLKKNLCSAIKSSPKKIQLLGQTSYKTIKKSWKADLTAGVSVAIVAIPQALAYANLAGLPPHLGLYAASIPTIIAALFSSSKVLSTGPTAITSLLTAASLTVLATANGSELLLLASSLTILVGLIQMALGAAKLGSFVNYIAHPVIAGFTTAAALIIALSQIPKLIGVEIARHPHFYETLIDIIKHLNQAKIFTLVLSTAALIFLITFKKLKPRFPGVLVVVVSGILISYLAGYQGSIVGEIPQNLPSLSLPDLFGLPLRSLFTTALIIAIVGYVEGVSIAKSLAKKTRDKIKPNQEVLAQGLANLSSGMLGSFPVAGSVSRTALTYSSGAQSKLASVMLGLISLVAIITLTPFLYYLPTAILAAIITHAVLGLIRFDEIIKLIKRRPRDGAVAAVTAVSAFIFAPHLDHGILIGILASILVHLHRSAKPRLEVFFCDDKDYLHSHHYYLRTYPSNKKIMGVSMESSLNFTNASYLQENILQEVKKHRPKPKYVMLICGGINYIDFSAEEILHHLHDELAEQKIELIFADLKKNVIDKMKRTELYEFIGGENIYPRTNLALKAIYKQEKTTTKKAKK